MSSRLTPAKQRRRAAIGVAVVLSVGGTLAFSSPLAADPVGVTAFVETADIPHSGDAAHDAAIWIDPADPARSVVIGTDKLGGLAVYDLQGHQLHYYADSAPFNVDLRYEFSLSGEPVALVTATDRQTNSLRVYRIDPATRGLVDVSARPISTGHQPLALCMYRSSEDGKYYAFESNSTGTMYQWELFDAGDGKVDARMVRSFAVGSTTSGCVADDQLGHVYVSERVEAIWRYGAEPDAGADRTQVDEVGGDDHLVTEVEGLALYRMSGGRGYLIASSEGSSSFAVYQRGADNSYLTSFKIEAGGPIDAVTRTAGIEVTNLPLDSGFADGAFVAHDDRNGNRNQNFKLVPWGRIAGSSTPLDSDTSFDSRQTTPVNSQPPAISGVPEEGGVLAAEPGSWLGSAPLSYSYRWQRCDASGSVCSEVAGATDGTYTVTSADAGSTLRVEVTAANGAGAGVASSDPTAPVQSRCPTFAEREQIGTVAFPEADEISGVAASRRNPGVLWVHNDSGDTERAFAMDTKGQLIATYRISDNNQSDWEDVAVATAPTSGTSYLYIGAIGGNSGREFTAMYRIPEPKVTPSSTPINFTSVLKFKMKYPNGEQHNAEALMVDPRNRDVYIVTKSYLNRAAVFRYPASAQNPAITYTLQRVRTLDIKPVTAGDIDPSGSEIVLKGYSSSYVWPRPAGMSVAVALKSPPCVLPHGPGEALGYAADGMSYFTVQEGSGVPIYRFARLGG
jgi:myo-inositol-hexaphosphate 3-phosphohydrolase